MWAYTLERIQSVMEGKAWRQKVGPAWNQRDNILFSSSYRKKKEKDQDRKWGPATKLQGLLLVVYFYF